MTARDKPHPIPYGEVVSGLRFDRPECLERYLELLKQYELPVTSMAATEVWVSAAYGRWLEAEAEAARWRAAWREFKAGKRDGWFP